MAGWLLLMSDKSTMQTEKKKWDCRVQSLLFLEVKMMVSSVFFFVFVLTLTKIQRGWSGVVSVKLQISWKQCAHQHHSLSIWDLPTWSITAGRWEKGSIGNIADTEGFIVTFGANTQNCQIASSDDLYSLNVSLYLQFPDCLHTLVIKCDLVFTIFTNTDTIFLTW